MYRIIFMSHMFILSVFGGPALAANATFACGAQGNDTCYFSVYYASGGVRNFTMKAGEQDAISGISIGLDKYCVTVEQGVPNEDTCSKKTVSDFNY